IAHLGYGLQVQTEHTILEEWSWRDDQGHGDSGGYEYSDLLNKDNDEEEDDDYDDEEHGNNNLELDIDEDEDEDSCEYSCPRYYRPVCVLRNGQPMTFATPCEFYNVVRCASVQQRRGQLVPRFEYLHNGAC
ncbi:hypothetical protein KR059_007730, partial [Drosophila kikkawai]